MEYAKVSLTQVCKNAYRLILDNPMACAIGILLYGIASLLLIGGLTLVNWSLIKDLIIAHPVIQTDNVAHMYIAYFKNHIAIMVTSYIVYMIGSTIVYAGSLLFFLTLFKKDDLTLQGIRCSRSQVIRIMWYFFLRLLLIAGAGASMVALANRLVSYGSLPLLLLLMVFFGSSMIIACGYLLMRVTFVPEVIIDQNKTFTAALRSSWSMAEGNSILILLLFGARFFLQSIMAMQIALFIFTPLIALLWVSAYVLIKKQKNGNQAETFEVV